MQIVEALEQAREEKQRFQTMVKEKEKEIGKLRVQVNEETENLQFLQNKAIKPAWV